MKIPKGSDLLLLQGSANRDEAVFENGETFDIARANADQHLSFGFGIHNCVGRQLARLEFSIALQELGRRFPGLRLVPDQSFEFLPIVSFRVPQRAANRLGRTGRRTRPRPRSPSTQENIEDIREEASMSETRASLYIAAFGDAPESDYPRMGGKCASLARMIKAGVRVPPGFAVTTDAYVRHVAAERSVAARSTRSSTRSTSTTSTTRRARRRSCARPSRTARCRPMSRRPSARPMSRCRRTATCLSRFAPPPPPRTCPTPVSPASRTRISGSSAPMRSSTGSKRAGAACSMRARFPIAPRTTSARPTF